MIVIHNCQKLPLSKKVYQFSFTTNNTTIPQRKKFSPADLLWKTHHHKMKIATPASAILYTLFYSPNTTQARSLTRNILLSLLDDDKVENAQVAVDDAATHRTTSPVSLTSRSKARMTFLEEQLHTAISKNTLLHGETLLVIATRDSHDIPLTGEKKASKI